MPQPKSSSSRSSGGGRKRSSTASRSSSSGSRPSAGSASSSRSAKKAGGAKKAGASSRGGTRAKGSGGGASRKSSGAARSSGRSAAQTPTSVDETLGATLNALRDRLSRGVVISAERLQETMDDTVRRGRMTRSDAEELIAHLVATGRKQTEDLLDDVETMLGRTRSELGTARDRVRSQAKRAAGPSSDRVLREVDRARRAVGIGPSFPILGYDDLAAAQITARLDDLNSAQLRKVRDYERRHANRKSVLDAIERNLK